MGFRRAAPGAFGVPNPYLVRGHDIGAVLEWCDAAEPLCFTLRAVHARLIQPAQLCIVLGANRHVRLEGELGGEGGLDDKDVVSIPLVVGRGHGLAVDADAVELEGLGVKPHRLRRVPPGIGLDLHLGQDLGFGGWGLGSGAWGWRDCGIWGLGSEGDWVLGLRWVERGWGF